MGFGPLLFWQRSPRPEVLNNQRFTLCKRYSVILRQKISKELSCRGSCGLSNDPTCDLKPNLTYNINFKGGINVAEAAKRAGVTRFVYSSSCSVYGQGALGLTEESEPILSLTTRAAKWMWKKPPSRTADAQFESTIFVCYRLRFCLSECALIWLSIS